MTQLIASLLLGLLLLDMFGIPLVTCRTHRHITQCTVMRRTPPEIGEH